MLLLAGVLHFGLVLIYANPYPHCKNKLDYYAEWYAYPYFAQNWNLFAPAPTTNYKLIAEYTDDGIKKVDVFEELLIKHQSNRLMGYGPVLLLFSNSIHYFEKNTDQQKKLNGPIKNNAYFEIIEKSTLNYLRLTRNKNITTIKIKLCVQPIDTNFARVYFN